MDYNGEEYKNNKWELMGSPTRDMFKYLHKDKMGRGFYATDLDLALIGKPDGIAYGIIGFIDWKAEGDDLTFSEVIAYNILKLVAPIFIVWGKTPEAGPFRILQYQKGIINPYPRPPTVHWTPRDICKDWAELKRWEIKLRQQRTHHLKDNYG